MSPQELIQRNTRICVAITFLNAMFFGTAFMTTYYLDNGLTQTQIYLLQVILYCCSVISDVPFGWLADRRGNRCVMVIGAGVALVQSLYFAWCTTFWQFSIALIATGIQVGALGNITQTAMDFSVNTIGDKTNSDSLYKLYLAKEAGWQSCGFATGIGIGGVLYSLWGMQAPYLAQPLVYSAMLMVSHKLVQPPQPLRPTKARQLHRVAYSTFKAHPKVRSIACLNAFCHSVAMTCFWIVQPRMQMADIPKWLYAPAYVAWALGTTVMIRPSTYIMKLSQFRVWLLLVPFYCACIAVAGLTMGPVGVVALFVIMTVNNALVQRLANVSLRESLPEDRHNRNAELSAISTIATIAAAIAGPIFGRCIAQYGLRSSLSWLALIAFGFGLLALWSFKRALVKG